MYKRGEDRYLSPWLFVIWGLIGLAVVGAVIIFYGAEADIRFYEANILGERIGDCVSSNGFLEGEFLIEGFDVFGKCELSREKLEESGEYYFRISFFDYDAREIRQPIEAGNKELEIQCFLSREDKVFAACYKEVIFLSYENRDVSVEIITASKNIGSKL